MIAYGAGLRVGEVVQLRLSDIDRERRVIHVRQGKGKKDRYTMLSPALAEILDRYLWAAQPEDLLFTTRRPDRPITPSTVQRYCIAARQASGIDKQISPLIRCGTVLPRTYWKPARTSGSFKCSWAMPVRGPRPFTPTSQPT
jgi:integrase